MPPYVTTALSPLQTSLSPDTLTPPFFTLPRKITTHHPVTFRWHHSTAKTVYLTGTFDNWSISLPMPRDPKCHDEFCITISLDRTKRWEFKFVVDGEWRCSAMFPTDFDGSGNVNNVLEPLGMDKLAEMTYEKFGRRRVSMGLGPWGEDEYRVSQKNIW